MTGRPKLTAITGGVEHGTTPGTGVCCDCPATFENDPGGNLSFAHAEATGHTTISHDTEISWPARNGRNRRAN